MKKDTSISYLGLYDIGSSKQPTFWQRIKLAWVCLTRKELHPLSFKWDFGLLANSNYCASMYVKKRDNKVWNRIWVTWKFDENGILTPESHGSEEVKCNEDKNGVCKQ